MSATVAVLGPGGVGAVLAVQLARAGARVVCVGRAEAVEAVRARGLVLERGGETLRASPEAETRLEQPVDLLLVTVKAFALAEALERVDPGAVAAGVALPLLNGLEHVEPVRARLGDRVAVGSIGRLEAFRRDATTVVQGAATPLVTIASDTLGPGGLTTAAELLRAAGAEVRVADRERAVLWEKAVRLAPLAALTAATGEPVGTLRRDERLRALLRSALEEASAVAAAEGVAVPVDVQWEMIEAMPETLTTSTARDVDAGRPSELDAIVGAVVRAGARAGVPTPTLAGLLEQAAER